MWKSTEKWVVGGRAGGSGPGEGCIWKVESLPEVCRALGWCFRRPVRLLVLQAVAGSWAEMAERRSSRLAGRRPMTEVEAATELLALAGLGVAQERSISEQSGRGEGRSSRTGSHGGATPPGDPFPMSDEEGDGDPGPSGLQAAEYAELATAQAEAEAEERESNEDQGGQDHRHSRHAGTAGWRPGEHQLMGHGFQMD